MKTFISLLSKMRLNFIILTTICISVGTISAFIQSKNISIQNVYLCLIAGLLAHIGVNTLNEYFTFKSGLDKNTVRTSFSGRSGALLTNPQHLNSVLAVSISCVIISFAICIYFVLLRGMWLGILGLSGIFIVLTYNMLIVKNPIFCYISPGFSFGVVFVLGSEIALSGNWSIQAVLCSIITLICVSNMLLHNQCHEIRAGKMVNRNTIPIVFGIKKNKCCVPVFYDHIIFDVNLWGNRFDSAEEFLIFDPVSHTHKYYFQRFKKTSRNLFKWEPILLTNVLMNIGMVLSLTVILFIQNKNL